MKAHHRLFFALVPEPPVIKRIGELQDSLQVSGRAARPHQFHATLAFLGMQRQETIPAIRAIASGLTLKPCCLELDCLGRFKRAGVLWLGISKVPVALGEFQQSLVGALADAGIGHDPKPWEFHVTLYRKLRKEPPIIDPAAIEWAVTGFDLVESVNVGNDVEYHSIGHWKAGQ